MQIATSHLELVDRLVLLLSCNTESQNFLQKKMWGGEENTKQLPDNMQYSPLECVWK